MATKYDFILSNSIDEGSVFKYSLPLPVAYTSVNLALYTVEMKVKNKREPDGVILIDLSPYVSIDPTAKTVNIVVPSNVLSLLSWTKGEYDITIRLTADATTRTRLQQGSITISRAVF
jgi:hypothetical protein